MTTKSEVTSPTTPPSLASATSVFKDAIGNARQAPSTGYLGSLSNSTASLSDVTPIEEVVEYIVKEKLGLSVEEEATSEWTYTLKKNLIKTAGLLQRLPTPQHIERLQLPLLLETELVKIIQDPSQLQSRKLTQDDSPPSPKGGEKAARSALLGITDEMRRRTYPS
jgi:hypothetical protein